MNRPQPAPETTTGTDHAHRPAAPPADVDVAPPTPVASPRGSGEAIAAPEMPPLAQDLEAHVESPYSRVSPDDERVLASVPHHDQSMGGAHAATRTRQPNTGLHRALSSLRPLGLALLILGLLMTGTGVGSYALTSASLQAEKITVPKDAEMFAGSDVTGPLTAWFTQATIRKHADGMADGKTYAELDREDPRRPRLQQASFLRSSLLVSVLAFGISTLIIGLGVIIAVLGFGLNRVGRAAQK